MTAHDHNKTLAIIYSSLGGLLAVALSFILINTVHKEREGAPPPFTVPPPSDSFPLELALIGIVFALLLLLTAYGLFRRRRWARIAALILAGLLVWLFPLGTLLAAYTWWFMHSEGGKHLYSRPSP